MAHNSCFTGLRENFSLPRLCNHVNYLVVIILDKCNTLEVNLSKLLCKYKNDMTALAQEGREGGREGGRGGEERGGEGRGGEGGREGERP